MSFLSFLKTPLALVASLALVAVIKRVYDRNVPSVSEEKIKTSNPSPSSSEYFNKAVGSATMESPKKNSNVEPVATGSQNNYSEPAQVQVSTSSSPLPESATVKSATVKSATVKSATPLEYGPTVESPADLEFVPVVESADELKSIPTVESPANLEAVPVVESAAVVESLPIVESAADDLEAAVEIKSIPLVESAGSSPSEILSTPSNIYAKNSDSLPSPSNRSLSGSLVESSSEEQVVETSDSQKVTTLSRRNAASVLSLPESEMLENAQDLSLVASKMNANQINDRFIQELSKALGEERKSPKSTVSPAETILLNNLLDFAKEQPIFGQSFWSLKDGDLEIKAISGSSDLAFAIVIDELEQPKSIGAAVERDSKPLSPKNNASSQEPKNRSLFVFGSDSKVATKIVLKLVTYTQVQPESSSSANTILLNEIEKFISLNSSPIPIMRQLEAPKPRSSALTFARDNRDGSILKSCLDKIFKSSITKFKKVDFIGSAVGKIELSNNAMVLYTPISPSSKNFNIKLDKQGGKLGAGWMIAPISFEKGQNDPMTLSTQSAHQAHAAGFVFLVVLNYAHILNMKAHNPNMKAHDLRVMSLQEFNAKSKSSAHSGPFSFAALIDYLLQAWKQNAAKRPFEMPKESKPALPKFNTSLQRTFRK